MSGSKSRTVLLGVTGGIACYKACELVRQLRGSGLGVRVVMTKGAMQFVTPLTFQALSGEPVGTDVFSASQEAEIGHIRLADEAGAVVVAPATAHVLAKMAHGLADDLLSTVLLATRAPTLVAPAMNVNMWMHPATQANVDILRKRGVVVVGPERGDLACGWDGEGRLAHPSRIVAAVRAAMSEKDLAGERVLVSAGPTWEAIDPVRFLSNRSTGRMGFAIARAAVERGASVTLVAGPTSLEPPDGLELVRVESAAEMAEAVRKHARRATVIVMAAAVADYRPETASPKKLKKGPGPRSLELVRTEDIVSGVAARKGSRLVVGFAAETHDMEREARRKLREKRLDLVVANDVTAAGAGFAGETNVVHLFDSDGSDVSLPLQSKEAVAGHILDWVVRARMRARVTPGRSRRRSPA